MLKKIHTYTIVGLFLFGLMFLYACATQQATEAENETETLQAQQPQQTEPAVQQRENLHVLFLGDNGHHMPLERFRVVAHIFTEKGIQVHYTDRQEDISYNKLKHYDVFMHYGNRGGLTRQQEVDLLKYVNNGGGFVSIHSSSASFNDSDAYVNLVGGAFKAHGAGTFSVEHVDPDHPVKQNVPQFESWDETYVHMRLNPLNHVLSVRVEGDHREPWTWVREEGEGRVFYTAWGHDQRTWSTEGFQQLLENAIRWTAGDWALEKDFSPAEFTYGEGKLPYYPEGEPWGTVGDPITDVQNPLGTDEALGHMVLPPEFEIKLFASEPDIVNPIDLAWDEQGRLWITETTDYPNRFTDDRQGNDRIKILEDTTGDGKADNITVFAEGLNIATGLVPYKGGIIVAQAPDFFFLQDTNGDGKADHKEVLFTGWGTFDTHAGPSNLRYGFDNQIWGVVGYSAFEGTVGGVEHSFSSGFYRFQPDGSSLEYISNTTNNTWGIGFSEDGTVLGSTANRDVPIHSVVPNRFYNNIRGFGQTPRIPAISNTNIIFPVRESIRQVDQHGRYTAGSGFELYTARDFPQEFWNKRGFVSEPTGRLLGQFRFEQNGSTYRAYNELNLLASLDDWFAPIQAKVGPDGALWIADWYNLIIQHNPTPENFERGDGNAYITDHRDKDHARIYRIVYKGAEERETPNLASATPNELAEALKHDNMFWRLTAQRLIIERGETDVLPALYDLVRDRKTDEIGLNPGAFHALWTMHGLGALAEEANNREALDVALAALHHPVTAVRRAALMTLPRTEEVLEHVLAAEFVPDTDVPGEMGYTMPAHTMMAADPQLRLAALLALAELPSHEKTGYAAAELLVIEQNAGDRWMRDGIAAAAANGNENSFLTRALEKQLPEDADSTYKANVKNVVEAVSRHYALGEDPSATVSGLITKLGGADAAITSGFLSGLAEGWPEEETPELNSEARNELRTIRNNADETLREHLDALSERWGISDLFGSN